MLHDILFDVFMVAFLYVMGNFRGGGDIFNDTLYELRKAYNNECKCLDKKHRIAEKFVIPQHYVCLPASKALFEAVY